MFNKHLLFLFLDGVGLGEDDPSCNPFCRAEMPTLVSLLGERWYLKGRDRIIGERASLAPTDACLGVSGRPQSATGQAVLLTGRNLPAEIGEHFGPKPTPFIAKALKNGNLFATVRQAGGTAVFLNPYPPRFFKAIKSGRRLLSAIPLAAQSAGLSLYQYEDLVAGRAISPDFTGEGWRDHLNFPDTPVITLTQAGERFARLAQSFNFVLYEHWPTDLLGHRRDFEQAVDALERFDTVLAGLLACWDWSAGTILITSDHGNIEDVSVRTHTLNPVPTIFIGRQHQQLAAGVQSLMDVAPAVQRALLEPAGR